MNLFNQPIIRGLFGVGCLIGDLSGFAGIVGFIGFLGVGSVIGGFVGFPGFMGCFGFFGSGNFTGRLTGFPGCMGFVGFSCDFLFFVMALIFISNWINNSS